MRFVSMLWIMRFTSLMNLMSSALQIRSRSCSKKHRYMMARSLTITGWYIAAVICSGSKILANASGIMESEEIMYGFPLKNGAFSFGIFWYSEMRYQSRSFAYSQIISSVCPSTFSRISAARDKSRQVHTIFKMSSTILPKPFSDSSIFTICVIVSERCSCRSISASDCALCCNASCAICSSILMTNKDLERYSKNCMDR